MDGVYDSLSRITSETRTFIGLSNQYAIGYGHNLAGEVTSITDPSGTQVNYNYDATGRLSSMPAAGYTGVTNFLSNTQYRASGAMKHATYGNNVQVDLSYNSRMQIGQYQVSGFQSPFGTMGATMSYYDDGRTNTAYDLNDSRFDRKYEFDFAARLKEAYSGVEAHGQTPPPPTQANSPYRQSYTYDQGNNVTLRTGRIWSTQNEYDQATYGSDNKRQGFGYDAAGNVTWTGNSDGTRTYDAAGRPVTFTSSQTWQIYPNWPSGHPNAPALETQDTFDGTGQVVRHVNHARHDDTYDIGGGNLVYVMGDTTSTTYYVHSTVLGGKTIEELDQNGSKKVGYVYSGGGRVATQTIIGGSNSVQIESTNPVTGAAIVTDVNGSSATRQEPDPLGRDLTQALDQTVVVDPLAGSKFNDPMPIEYAPNWTGEMETGMSQYVDTMDMIVAREAYKRWLRGGDGTTNADYDIWQNTLAKNPNVGVRAGKETHWGKDAAAFLEDNADSISLGENGITLRPVSGSGNAKVSFRKDVEKGFDRVQRILQGTSKCAQFFGSHAPEALAAMRKKISLESSNGPGGTSTGIAQSNYPGGVNYIPSGPYRTPGSFTVYTDGPFFMQGKGQIAGYKPGSPQAQTAAILHELAHNIKNAAGNGFLIPNDDPRTTKEGLSQENTALIKKICGKEIFDGH